MNIPLTKKDILHSAIGGGICFLGMVFLSSIMNIALQRILMTLGILTVTVFEPFAIAKTAIAFALVYLTSGFLGGLYTGYSTEKDIKIAALITGVIGFVGFILLLFLYGRLNLNMKGTDYLDFLILPLMGNIIGAFLGGYTIIWPSRSEEIEEAEEEGISLELEQ